MANRYQRSFFYLRILLAALIVFGVAPMDAEARLYRERSGLFEMEVPDGWVIDEDAQQIRLQNQTGTAALTVVFGPRRDWKTQIEIEEGLMGSQLRMIQYVLRLGGTVLREYETDLGGHYARRLDFVIPVGGNHWKMSEITFVADRAVISIHFGALSNQEMDLIQVDNIIGSFRVLTEIQESEHTPQTMASTEDTEICVACVPIKENQVVQNQLCLCLQGM